MLRDDVLAQPLEREPHRHGGEAVVALAEGPQETLVLGIEVRRQRPLQCGEERLADGVPAHERVVRDADERRREHGGERDVVVAVVEQAEVEEEVDHLLLAEVPLARRAVGRQPRSAQLLLVPLGVRPGGEEEDDLTRRGRAGVHELADAPRDVASLGAPPVLARVAVARLVGDEELDRVAEDRIRELAGGGERLVLVAEVGAEELVDRREHLGPRAVVARQREKLRRLLTPLAEHLHVRVTEPVDGLELVAHEEDLFFGRAAREQVDQLALEPVRVLELVDHDQAEAELLGLAHGRVVAEQVARGELEILEVERRLARLRGRVLLGEAAQEVLEEVAVAGGELLERRLLEALARLLVRRGAWAARAEVAQVEQHLRVLAQLERLRRVAALQLRRLLVVRETPRGLPHLRAALREARALAELEHEVAPGRAQRLVDVGEHPAQAVRAVGRKEPQPLVVPTRAEVLERALERFPADDRALRLVELAEAWVDPDREGMRPQQPRAEAVDGRDPCAVEPARQVVAAPLAERGADSPPQLPGGLARVGEDEDGVDVDAAVAHGADEALDDHGRLARPGAGRDEDLAAGLDRRDLLGIHGLATLHIVQTSHHVGHSPPFGSWRMSPARMRRAYSAARSRAVSIWPQNSSSPR